MLLKSFIFKVSKPKTIILTLFICLGVILTSLVTKNIKKGSSAILVESDPKSDAFIDGVEKGETPLIDYSNKKEIFLKLVPVDDKNYPPYQTNINLEDGVKTIVRRNFGPSEDTSSVEIISFEREVNELTALTIISVPDQANLYINGKYLGQTPQKISELKEGRYEVTLGKTGYVGKEIQIQTKKGFNLTLFVKLAAKST
jgi:hypothetical protein